MQISILIVTYNSANFINACLDSILLQQDVSLEIIVVDNASQDNTVSLIQSYGEKVKLFINKENKGFSTANNQAFLQARGKYLFLLNPDAIFQHAQDLKNMLIFMQENPQFGLVGTQVLKTSTENYSAPQYYYPGQRYTNIDFSDLPGKIAWVIGASMLIRSEVYAGVRGFDEDYFLYGDEADLCLRIRRQGYQIGYNPLVMVKHYGGGSEITTPPDQLWQKKQNGLHLFMKKNYPKTEASKVAQRNLKRAKWRLCFLKCGQWLGLMNTDRLIKYTRYSVVYRTSKAFLAEL